MSIRIRIQDWLLEREIRKLGHHFIEARAAGRREEAALLWAAQVKAINSRSPAQVARMESKMGIRSRRAIKQKVMTAFLFGFLPAPMVIVLFKLFRLRGL